MVSLCWKPEFRRQKITVPGWISAQRRFLKLFEKIYARLAAGLQDLFSGDANLSDNRISNIDMLHLGISTALKNLPETVGL